MFARGCKVGVHRRARALDGLGPPRRSRRVEADRRRRDRGRVGQRGVALGAERSLVVVAGVKHANRRMHAFFSDEQPCTRVFEQVRHLVVLRAPRDRYQLGAGARGPERDLEELDAVPQRAADAIAGADARRAEGACDAVRATVELLERYPARSGDDRDVVGVGARARLESDRFHDRRVALTGLLDRIEDARA